MAAFFSFHLLFVVLKRTVKISVERNKRFHSLWVIGIIINVMVPTQPLEAVVSMHIIRHLLSVSYWHDRLQQLFWTVSHIKQNQQNYLRSPLEEALNLGFSCPFQFCVKLKIWWHLLNVFEDDPVTLDSIFFPSLGLSWPHGRDQTFAVGARLSLAVSMTTPTAEGRMRGQTPELKEINMLPPSFTLSWSVAAWHEGHPQTHKAKTATRCVPSLFPIHQLQAHWDLY